VSVAAISWALYLAPVRPIKSGSVQRAHGSDEASRSWSRNLGIRMLYAVGHTKIGLLLQWVSRKRDQALVRAAGLGGT